MRDSLHAPGGFDEGTAIAVGHTGVHHDPLEDDAAAGPPAPRRDGGDDRETTR